MKKELIKKEKRGCFRSYQQCAEKKLAWMSKYAESSIVFGVVGFLCSIAIKLFLPNLAPNHVNSLTIYRASVFLVLLGLALLVYRQKQKD